MNRKSSSRAPVGLALLVVALAGGCAPTWRDFKMSSVGPEQAAIAGRLTIVYNGRVFTDNCFATFAGERYKLATGGIVLFRVARGWTALERLDCKDTSMQHVRIRGAHFLARGDGYVTDFGDIAVSWNAAGGFKVSNLFGMVGAIIDESMDDGVATVEVRPPVVEVRDAFRRQTGGDARWAVHQLSQPTSRDAPPPEVADAAASARRDAGDRGFFCTTAPLARGMSSVCERGQSACEHVRGVLGAGASACTPAETAWCFVGRSNLRCAATKEACLSQIDKAVPASDVCGEQY